MGTNYVSLTRKSDNVLRNKEHMAGGLHAPSPTPGGTCLIETLLLEQKGRKVRRPTEVGIVRHNFPPTK